jgi:hypothetical protein
MIRQFFKNHPQLISKAYLSFALLLLIVAIKFHDATQQGFSLISPQNAASTLVTDTNLVQKASAECRISDTFTPEVKYWEEDICRWSKEHQMDPDLIATIMQIESCGDDRAVSATGVRGLFQVTGANLDGQNPFDPNVSMAKGPGKVLKSELEATNGNIKAALAGYNGGPWARQWVNGQLTTAQFVSRLRNHGSGFWRTPARANAKVNEVKWYAEWSNIFYEAKNNETDTLDKWLALGGSRLCTQAATRLGLPTDPVFAGAEVEKK